MTTRDGQFLVAEAFAPYLLSQSPQCFTRTFLDLSQARHTGLCELADLIAGKPTNGTPPTFDTAHWQHMQASLDAFHASVAADEMLGALSSLPEWVGARRILDVGGGSFTLASRIIDAHPNAQVTLFDLPEMIDCLGPAPHRQISVHGGNYNVADTLPAGPFDIIWCSMALYFARDDLAKVLTRFADRLADGGVIVSFHEDLSPDRCHPARHVIGRTVPALAGKDLSFSGGAIANAFMDAGLVNISSTPITTPFGPYRLDIGKKNA